MIVPNRQRTLRQAFSIVALCVCVIGCDKRQSFEISEFSDRLVTISHEDVGAGIVGLKIDTKGTLSNPLQMNIGAGGKVLKTLFIPETGTYSEKLDWYDKTLEFSFVDGERNTGNLVVSFQFITL